MPYSLPVRWTLMPSTETTRVSRLNRNSPVWIVDANSPSAVTDASTLASSALIRSSHNIHELSCSNICDIRGKDAQCGSASRGMARQGPEAAHAAGNAALQPRSTQSLGERIVSKISRLDPSPRPMFSGFSIAMSYPRGRRSGGLRRRLDRSPDPLIGTAPANIAGHARVDIGIAGVRIAGQQRGRRHDLARLAVAALNYFEIEPGLLNPFAGPSPMTKLINGSTAPYTFFRFIWRRSGATTPYKLARL